MPDLDSFRAETRAWLEENCPPSARGDARGDSRGDARGDSRGSGYVPIGSSKIELEPDTRLWLDRMVERGWTVPTWPKQYGGAELDKDEYKVLIEELQRINARTPLTGRGVNYIGPTILEFGTDEQKTRWLPKCARGEGAWAMGYSEPGAGSDLANLRLRAERDGDQWVLNGSKIWTSDAVICDYIFVLCRTSPDKPKHEGISLILVDMSQPGVTPRPIELISGESNFCETVFDNATAPAGDLIGGIDKGWTVGKRLLQFERSTHAGINLSGSQGGRTVENNVRDLVRQYAGDANGDLKDPAIRDRLLRFEMNTAAQRLTQQRAVEEAKARAPGFTSSSVKLSNGRNTKDGDELVVTAMGSRVLCRDTTIADAQEIASAKQWLYQKALTIAGGTEEVQLNIIAKRVLGLPD